jgi:hypothetical protein
MRQLLAGKDLRDNHLRQIESGSSTKEGGSSRVLEEGSLETINGPYEFGVAELA